MAKLNCYNTRLSRVSTVQYVFYYQILLLNFSPVSTAPNLVFLLPNLAYWLSSFSYFVIGIEKPLTKGMTAFLGECEEREFLNLPPFYEAHPRLTAALIKRGMLTMRVYTRRGKGITSLYLTQRGRDYLKL